MNWKTFQGKEASTDTVDHQHLSNCYWFAMIVLGVKKEGLEVYKQAMRERFNGQILPYRPHVDFTYEIDFLKEKRYIQSTDYKTKEEIYFNGILVGEILYPMDETFFD